MTLRVITTEQSDWEAAAGGGELWPPRGATTPALRPPAERARRGWDAGRRWRRPRLSIPLTAPISESGPRAEVGRRDAVSRRSLALADLLAASAAVVLWVVVFGHGALDLRAVAALPLILITGKAVGVYDRDELVISKGTIDETPRLFQLATLYTLLFSILQSGFVSRPIGPAQVVGLWGTLLLLTFLARASARAGTRAVMPPERCLFVGTEASLSRLRAKLAGSGGNALVVGRMTIEDSPSGPAEAAAVLHKVVEELGVHRVVIEPGDTQQATLDFVREAKGTGARVSLLPRILEVVGSSIEIDDVDGLTLLGLRQFGLSRSSGYLKRGFDLIGASVLLVLLAPFAALAAVLVRLDSPGPVIYRQTRVGRDGRPFTMLKFRTMSDGADALKPSLRPLNEAVGLFKIADDPRVTRVGRWLRRYSLDELPQLINVLRGDMSLVGPRPLVSDDDAQITGLDRRRLQLTPGMTGQWQILGSARIPLPEMLKLDYLYVTGWSLWSDVKILLRTVPYVLARRGM